MTAGGQEFTAEVLHPIGRALRAAWWQDVAEATQSVWAHLPGAGEDAAELDTASRLADEVGFRGGALWAAGTVLAAYSDAAHGVPDESREGAALEHAGDGWALTPMGEEPWANSGDLPVRGHVLPETPTLDWPAAQFAAGIRDAGRLCFHVPPGAAVANHAFGLLLAAGPWRQGLQGGAQWAVGQLVSAWTDARTLAEQRREQVAGRAPLRAELLAVLPADGPGLLPSEIAGLLAAPTDLGVLSAALGDLLSTDRITVDADPDTGLRRYRPVHHHDRAPAPSPVPAR